MSCPISTDNPGPINGEHNRKTLNCDVVYELVVRALQKRRVNCDDRPHSLSSKAGAKSQCMLLSNTNIKIALRKATLEIDKTGSFPHRWRNGHDPCVLFCFVTYPVAKNLRVGNRFCLGRLNATGEVDWTIARKISSGAVILR